MAREEDRLRMSRGYAPAPTNPTTVPNVTRTRTSGNPDPATTERIRQEREAAMAAREGSADIFNRRMQGRQLSVQESLNPATVPNATRTRMAAFAQLPAAQVPDTQLQVRQTPALQPQTQQTPVLQTPTDPPAALRPSGPAYTARQYSPGVTAISRPGEPTTYTNLIEAGASPGQVSGFMARTLDDNAAGGSYIETSEGRQYEGRRGTESPEFQRLYAKHGPQGGTPVSRVLEENPTGQALDFGRNRRDRLNSLYARNLDMGQTPAEAAESARVEELATSSLGGRVEAGILEGIRNRRTAATLATAKTETERAQAEANIGKTQAEMDQIGQTNAIMRRNPEFGEAVARQRLGVSTKALAAPPGMDDLMKSVLGGVTVTPSDIGGEDTVTVNAMPGVKLAPAEAARLFDRMRSLSSSGMPESQIDPYALLAEIRGTTNQE